jgi:NADPH:quinone reductase-like Zn-dependent oxidoreductase
MKALLLNAESKTASVSLITPIPVPQHPTDLLIRVEAIALNPVDALYTFNPIASSGRIIGSDFAGIVVQIGPPSPDTNNTHHSEGGEGAGGHGIIVGDRVAGFVQGANSGNDRPGAGAEYVVCPAELVWKVPEGMELEQAAAVSLCGLTAAQGLFYRLGLRAPFEWEGENQQEGGNGEEEEPLRFFIYGASTSVGMYAAQLVRRSCEVSGRKLMLIGAASKARWGMLKAVPYGYDELVDYREADWPEQVRRLAGGDGVDFAYDAISEGETVGRVASTLREGGKIAIVRSRAGRAWAASEEGLSVEPIYGAVWEGLGHEIQYQGFVVPASPKARRFAAAFYKWLSQGGKLEPNPIRLMPGGLDRVVEDGFSLLGTGTMEDRGRDRSEEWMRPISAEKLVYRVRE